MLQDDHSTRGVALVFSFVYQVRLLRLLVVFAILCIQSGFCVCNLSRGMYDGPHWTVFNTGTDVFGMATDRIGNVYYCAFNINKLRVITVSGNVIEKGYTCTGIVVDFMQDQLIFGERDNGIIFHTLYKPNQPFTSLGRTDYKESEPYLGVYPNQMSIHYRHNWVVSTTGNGHTVIYLELDLPKRKSGIKILAGSHGNSGGQDGTFTQARFDHPLGLAVHEKIDVVYVGEYYVHRVRRLDLVNEIVSVLAGVAGTSGNSDGKPGTFFHPFYIALDGADNLLVAEIKNTDVRKISLKDSCVSTIIGKPEEPDIVPSPRGIFVDQNGRALIGCHLSIVGLCDSGCPSPPYGAAFFFKTRTNSSEHSSTESLSSSSPHLLTFSPTPTQVSSTQTRTISPAKKSTASGTTSIGVNFSKSQTRSQAPMMKSHSMTEEPPPSKKQASTEVVTVMASVFGGDVTAADAVQGTGFAGASLSGMTGISTALANAGRMRNIVAGVYCNFVEQDDDSENDDEEAAMKPSWLEAIVVSFGGKSKLRYFFGSSVVTTVIVVLFCLTLQMLLILPKKCVSTEQREESSHDTRSTSPLHTLRNLTYIVGILTSLTLQGYQQSVVSMSMTLLIHGEEDKERAAGGCCIIVEILTCVWLGYHLIFSFKARNAASMPSNSSRQHKKMELFSASHKHILRLQFENSEKKTLFLESFGVMFDATKDCSHPVHRSYFLEELICSAVVGAIAGVRPKESNCYPIACSLLVISVLHLVFLLVFRPYRTKIDMGFSFGFACNQVLISIFCIASISNESMLKPLGVFSAIQNFGMFIQIFPQCFWLYVLHERRKMQQSFADSCGSSSGNGHDNSSPLREEEKDDDEDNQQTTSAIDYNEQQEERGFITDRRSPAGAGGGGHLEVPMLTMPQRRFKGQTDCSSPPTQNPLDKMNKDGTVS